jgi:CheY-like chemotaxis protein
LRLADRRKDEFLAMLAHELRNPLTPLQHAAEILKLNSSGEDADKAANILDRQLRSFARIIDDLLDAARIAQGKIELKKERVELGSLLRNAIQSARHHFETKHQELKISVPETPIYLQADGIRLEQAFGNLLHNASKYTGAGGHIELSAELAIFGEPEVMVRVQDDGIGIDVETLPHIFELFMQGSSSLDRTQGGLGIGLTLVQRIVSLHGGSVTANSGGLGRGTEFVVRLPATLEIEAAHEHQPQVTSQSGNKRILVVDDSMDTIRAMEIILRLQGYEVITATNGAVAIQTAMEFRPEIVILDIGLPDMDGFEVARELRRAPQLEKSFMVALTGYGTARDRELARKAGFDQLLTKPVHPVMLLNFIAQGITLKTTKSG